VVDEAVDRRKAHLEVVAQAAMRGVQEPSELREIAADEGRDRPLDASVFGDDVAHAAAKAAMGEAEPGIYELGGPEVATFRELMKMMLGVIRRRRLILGIPFGIASVMAAVMEFVQTITFGLIPPQITRDQVRSLKVDNVVSVGARTFADLGIEPVAMEAVLPDYLWRFRIAGQYEAIHESARNLKA